MGASNLLSLADGSRLIPLQSDNDVNGYTPSSITVSSDPLSLNRNVVIDEDDIYRYAEEETTEIEVIDIKSHMKNNVGLSTDRCSSSAKMNYLTSI